MKKNEKDTQKNHLFLNERNSRPHYQINEQNY